MTYGSLFRGGGGADMGLDAAGLKCLWSCEIDAKCNDVARMLRPDVPVVLDVRDHAAFEGLPAPDVLWMSPPCQDLSVAGKRKGLAGERSGLFYDAITVLAGFVRRGTRLALMEQVPGLLSSNAGEDIRLVLDAFEDLRMIVDLDILDSQCFGVPQRRRRVYIVAESVTAIQKSRTLTSSLTILQALVEISQCILGVLSDRLPIEPITSEFTCAGYADGLRRRMKLFGLPSENKIWGLLLNHWGDPSVQHLSDGESLGLGHGPKSPVGLTIRKATSSGKVCGTEQANMRGSFSNTALSWQSILDDLCAGANVCITSTSTRTTIESTIFTCALALEHIASAICRLIGCSQTSFVAASSALTGLQAYTNYARQASSDLFADMDRVQPWTDFANRSARLQDTLLNSRFRSWGEILALSYGMSGHPAPSREAGERVAGTIAAGAHPSGFNGQDAYSGNLVQDVAGAIGSHTTQITSKANRSNPKAGDPCHPLASGAHAPAVAFGWNKSESQTLRVDEATTDALQASSTSNPAVAFTQNQAGDVLPNDRMHSLGTNQNATGRNAANVAQGMSVRRLMPIECERLQSWPDGSTKFGKRENGQVYELADGPRYKILGNGVTSNVSEWLGRQLMAVLT